MTENKITGSDIHRHVGSPTTTDLALKIEDKVAERLHALGYAVHRPWDLGIAGILHDALCGFVVGTVGETTAPAEESRRVQDLLEANSRLVKRARTAEAQVKLANDRADLAEIAAAVMRDDAIFTSQVSAEPGPEFQQKPMMTEARRREVEVARLHAVPGSPEWCERVEVDLMYMRNKLHRLEKERG